MQRPRGLSLSLLAVGGVLSSSAPALAQQSPPVAQTQILRQAPTRVPLKQTPGTPTSVVVAANATWTPTGVTVRRGGRLAIAAQGRWSIGGASTAIAANVGAFFGPDGEPGKTSPRAPLPSANFGALIGRIGEGPPFLIGAKYDATAAADGPLFVAINDDAPGDNQGRLALTATASPPPTSPSTSPPTTSPAPTRIIVPRQPPLPRPGVVPARPVDTGAPTTPQPETPPRSAKPPYLPPADVPPPEVSPKPPPSQTAEPAPAETPAAPEATTAPVQTAPEQPATTQPVDTPAAAPAPPSQPSMPLWLLPAALVGALLLGGVLLARALRPRANRNDRHEPGAAPSVTSRVVSDGRADQALSVRWRGRG